MNNIKIIFLDIDGVMTVYNKNGYDKYGVKYNSTFVNNLNNIIKETDAKIVISSTHRSYGIEHFQNMWKFRGYVGEVVGITPYHKSRNRGKEIDMFIEDKNKHIFNNNKSYNITNYVILDDDNDMMPHQSQNFVRCSENQTHKESIDGGGFGLTNECSLDAINILNSVKLFELKRGDKFKTVHTLFIKLENDKEIRVNDLEVLNFDTTYANVRDISTDKIFQLSCQILVKKIVKNE